MFKNLLLPADLTDKHEQALQLAAELAAAGQGIVTLLHIVEEIHGMSQQEEKPFYERLERIARRHLQTLGKVFDERKIPWQIEVCCGRRAQDTVRVASEKQVDLIILTSPRYDPDNPRQSWGSLSYPITFLAPCPVLLVR
jgi:nucleotide-binding universal stress UspA family protein